MTAQQRQFWISVKLLATATRRRRDVDYHAAADALALEEEIQARLDAAEQPALMVAEQSETAPILAEKRL